MSKKKVFSLILLIIAVLTAVSCFDAKQDIDASVPSKSPLPNTPFVTETPAEPDTEDISFVTPAPTESATLAPVPTPSPTPEPTPTPSPTPTPVPERIGIIKYELIDRFSDTATDSDELYRDSKHSITLTRYETTKRTGKTLVYFVVDIYVQDVESIRRAIGREPYSQNTKTEITKLAKRENAIVAMSGDNGYPRVNSYVVINGELVYKSAKYSRDLCVLFRDGEIRVYSPKDISPEYLEARGVWQTWNFGPILLGENGEPPEKYNLPDRIGDRNPRAAIGYYEPGHYCFVLCDGRQEGYSMGLTLNELSQLMKDLGCTVAYNLDGGITAQLVWHNKRINHPGDQRNVRDIVYIPYPTESPKDEGAQE